jgi:cytochrome bd-type quinol oxidase subunit 2
VDQLRALAGPQGAAGARRAGLLVSARRTLSAFVASSLGMLGVIGTAGAAMFPFIMSSSDQSHRLGQRLQSHNAGADVDATVL